MPRVSVVIPFYDRTQWLAEAVRSVLRQTYSDFEIILVDDGSTEDASFILNWDSRIIYLRQDNKGPSAARNRGLDEARGEYVAFLDSDDVFLPSKLEKQVALMEDHHDVLLSHTSYQRMSARGEDMEVVNSGMFTGPFELELIYRCEIATPTVVIRRAALKQGLRFEESVRIGEDIILWLRFVARSRLIGISEPLTKVRMHGLNAILDPEKLAAGRLNVLSYIAHKDKVVIAALSRKELSAVHLDLAYLYLQNRRKAHFLRALLRAIVTRPLHIRIYATLLGRLVASVSSRLRHVGKARVAYTVMMQYKYVLHDQANCQHHSFCS